MATDTLRPFWKGELRLSLVSIGVTLYAATQDASRPQLRQIHKPSGKRIRYENVVPGIGPVDSEDIAKGFQLDNDAYVVLEPEEREEIKLESRHAIELVQFVDYCEVDPRYWSIFRSIVAAPPPQPSPARRGGLQYSTSPRIAAMAFTQGLLGRHPGR